ncbi:hypothetical protein AAFC00_003172 [Neodothiora populina]
MFDTSPAPFPSKNIRLAGEHVTIVGTTAAHAPALFEQTGGSAHASLYQYLFDGPYDTIEDLSKALARQAADNATIFYTILLNNDGSGEVGKPVGQFALMRIDAANRVVEVGHVLYTPKLQRTPAATEAIFLLASHVFEDLGYRRFEWKCNSLNMPSRRAALRLGFTYEGMFRQHMFQRGKNRDTTWFSMLDGEWPGCKKAFQSWLSADNFDEAAKQRTRLEDFRSN